MASFHNSRKRLLLSLHHTQILSRIKLNFNPSNFRPISTSIIHQVNPNFSSSSSSNLLKIISPFRFSPLINNPGSKFGFNGGQRAFASRLSESNNGPPKKTIMLEGCDFEHWLVQVEDPDHQLTRDEIIDGYIKTLAQVIGSEEDARMKIYSVSTRHYFAFGALISEELGYKLKELPNVRWVLPDSYMDVKNKTYAGEPFINGQAVPYDPKYHEIWVRNHEESLRSNNKNRKRQKDPNSRSRSPAFASTHDDSNGNWKSSPIPHNQSPETSNTQKYTSSPSSVPIPATQQGNRMPIDDTRNIVAQSTHMRTPSPMRNHDLKQAHPSYSHNQAPSTYSHNQAPSTYHHNQAPSTYYQNHAPPDYSQYQAFQPPGMHDHTMSWTPSPPIIDLKNQSRHSSHMQNQTPPPSSTSGPNDPARHSQFQSWETPHQVQNGRAHISQYQQYQQHNSGGVQSSYATTSPQDWNYPGNAPISHGMGIQQVQHNKIPRPVQNINYQDSAALNAGYNEGKSPDDTSIEIRRTRDCQERDNSADEYMYASKL